MESERRNDEDSYADMEASAAVAACSFAGRSEYSEQADRVLHRTSDFDAGRILDIPQLTGKPGECDLAFYFSGSVHWDSGSAPDSKHSTWENQ